MMATNPLAKSYLPIVRTRDAEMKGVENASKEVLDAVLPLFELTQSRRSKNNANGAVRLCAERINAVMGERPFIVDVTSLSSFQNEEIVQLLSQDNAFERWCKFVEVHFGRNCIPIVHLTDPLDDAQIRLEISRLAKQSGRVAVRLPLDYDASEQLRRLLIAELGSLKNVVLIADAGFVLLEENYSHARSAESLFRDGWLNGTGLLAVASSGFPNSVVPKYGSDAYGKFKLAEVDLSKRVQATLDNVIHSDYCLIHPNDFDGIVTNWVPRVDVPLEEELFYHRYRREVGGYVEAAQEALADSDYVAMDCWADTNIRAAAAGDPIGKNPAHWIAVRVNFHLHRQCKRLGLI